VRATSVHHVLASDRNGARIGHTLEDIVNVVLGTPSPRAASRWGFAEVVGRSGRPVIALGLEDLSTV
jgi:hypothetical protein